MAHSRESSALRQLVGDVVSQAYAANTHAALNAAFAELGMPPVAKEEGSLRERVELSFARVPDSDLPDVAQRVLAREAVSAATRNAIEDLLWARSSPPQIPKRIRRELSRGLDLEELVRSEARFMALLERFWVLDHQVTLSDLFLSTPGRSLRHDIEQHVFHNRGDWSTEILFEHLGAFDAGDARFARFLEGAVSAEVLLDESAQRLLVDAINTHLRSAGIDCGRPAPMRATRALP